MMKKVLPLAIATAMMSSFAHADVKLFGTIAAEVGSVKKGTGDRKIVTDSDLSDSGSANKLGLAISEKLGAGLEGFALIDWEYDTFESTSAAESANFKNREKFVGVKHTLGHVKLGRVQGIYKTSSLGYDKWVGTGMQARTNGAGMSGGVFGHGGYIDNILEVGFNVPAGPAGNVKATVQYIADETVVGGVRNDGSILGALQMGNKDFEFTVAGAQQRNKDAAGKEAAVGGKLTNWKVAGKFTLGGLYLALQYEKVKTAQAAFGIPAAGTLIAGTTIATDPTEFVWGGLGYRMGNVELFGWAGGIMKVKLISDVTSGTTSGIASSPLSTTKDVLGYSVGAMYHFSKNMFAYAGYHKTDDKKKTATTDYSNEMFLGGLRLNF
jgi:predicted porin